MSKPYVLTDSDRALLMSALDLKRQSVVRAQRTQIPQSEMWSVLGRQIAEIDNLRNNMYSLTS